MNAVANVSTSTNVLETPCINPAPIPPERHGGVVAGERAPDAPLRGAGGQRTRLFDLLRGPHWTLIARAGAAAGLPIAGPRLPIHRIGTGGDLQEVESRLGADYGMEDGDQVLVRPDGYFGALVTAGDPIRIGSYLSGVGVTAA
jgi:Aromatic-ring hydroxylase, C-terminal